MRKRRRLAVALALLAAALLAGVRSLERPRDAARVPPQAEPRPAPSAVASPAPSRWLASLGDAALEEQVGRVVESFDRTGRPPDGVVQGGRRGGPRGVFDNAQGKLPRRVPGYYRESDVWPRGAGGRGAERLVLGREGEVYYTGDHYRSFLRLR